MKHIASAKVQLNLQSKASVQCTRLSRCQTCELSNLQGVPTSVQSLSR